jgi:amino acid adenylation domain-containing protein
MKNVAIIGMSGTFPEAKTIDEFSINLLNSKCSIQKISEDRLLDTCISKEINTRKGGYLEKISGFDNDFFEIALGEAEEIAPNQRLMLQESYKVFEQAGYRLNDLKGSNTGVYVADTEIDYHKLASIPTPSLIAGNISALIGSRISRFFDLRGVALNVDTTCSSSLTAIITACKDIQLDDVDLALVCSINVNVVPPQKDTKIVLGVESEDDSCNPFSDKANGALHGEAVICLLLKSEEQAIKDGDTIYGIIKGYALNQDAAQSSSIMSPSPEAQAQVINAAIEKANLKPSDIDFIEAHGTGTKLGDPIEIDGLSQVFAKNYRDGEKLPIGTIKSNIGHCDSAAGMAGVVKTLLSFKNKVIYPSVNSRPLNGLVDFDSSKIEVVAAPIELPKDKILNAGISSFGLMGTNAHLIVASYQNQFDKIEDVEKQLTFCFSAKTEMSLKNYLSSFSDYFSKSNDSLQNISYTLNAGRNIFPYNYVVQANNKSELISFLNSGVNESNFLSAGNLIQDKILLFDESQVLENESLVSLEIFNDYDFQNLNHLQKSVLVQYQSYNLLQKSGIIIKDMIGIGVGKLTIQIIKNELTIEQALEKLKEDYNEERATKEDLINRTNVLTSRFTIGVQIINVGYKGTLGELLNDQFKNSKNEYRMIGYNQSTDDNILNALNISCDTNLDLKVFYTTKHSLVNLPSYCFEEKRCWIREIDNPYHPDEILQTSNIDKVASIDSSVSIEEQLVVLWNEILKMDVKSDSDFFELGGHSLNGTQLINRINQVFNLEFTIDTLFEYGTPEEMAQFIEEQSVNIKNEVKSEIVVVDKKDFYDVSFAQKRLWMLSKMSKNTSSLNVPITLHVAGEIDYEKLVKAFQLLIERHESLRTTFSFINGEIKQKIHSPLAFDFSLKYEIKEFSSKELQDKYIEKLESEIFDLDNESPLIRANLVKIGPSEFILNITLHHLISDGWSMQILHSELNYFYSKLTQNETPQLSPLKINYKDYAAWQLTSLNTSNFKEAESYWLDKFEKPVSELELLLQNKRPAVKTYNGAQYNFAFDLERTNTIREFLKSNKITLTMFVNTILNILVYKLSGENDITLGMPIAERGEKELENQIGLYLNTLALRNELSKQQSFIQLLENTSTNLKEAYKNSNYPFELLIEKLSLKKNFSRSPLFDIAFVVQNFGNLETNQETKNVENNEVVFTNYDFDNHSSSQFDLLYQFIDEGDSITYRLEYNTDIFTTDSILSYSEFFQNVVDQCLSNIEITLEEITLLSSENERQILNELAGRDIKLDVSENLNYYLKETFKKYKNNIAVKYENEELNYSQLESLSNKLANYLLDYHSLEYQDCVVISCEITPLLITSILGILKAGLVYVPIDKKLPQSRKDYIIDQVKAKLIIDDNWLAEFAQNTETISDKELNIEVNTNDLAYIIFTSGSTGNPKGVMISHKNLAELLLNCNDAHYDITDKDVWTLFHNYSFDFSIWEIFGPLFFGGKLVLINRNKILDFNNYFDLITDEGVTILNFTPKAYVEFENLRQKKNLVFDKVRYVVFGGDILYPENLHKWKLDHPNCELINMYGITEITVHGTFKKLSNEEIFSQGSLSNIGKPIQGFKFYILDENFSLLPMGAVGEIYVSGNQVSLGYFNRPDLTNDRFLPVPKGLKNNSIMYKTGDLAKWLPNGDMQFIGRADNQVKLNGFRVELDEIQKTLLQLDEVIRVYVKTAEELNNTILLLFFEANEQISESKIKEYLKNYLPHYMIPDYIVQINEIILDSNGKIDKNQFPSLEELKKDKQKNDGIVNEVADDTRLIIHRLFCEILNFDGISLDENFLELGGTSLQLIRLQAELDSIWPNKVQISDLFEYNTINQISDFIDSKESVQETETVTDFLDV